MIDCTMQVVTGPTAKPSRLRHQVEADLLAVRYLAPDGVSTLGVWAQRYPLNGRRVPTTRSRRYVVEGMRSG